MLQRLLFIFNWDEKLTQGGQKFQEALIVHSCLLTFAMIQNYYFFPSLTILNKWFLLYPPNIIDKFHETLLIDLSISIARCSCSIGNEKVVYFFDYLLLLLLQMLHVDVLHGRAKSRGTESASLHCDKIIKLW